MSTRLFRFEGPLASLSSDDSRALVTRGAREGGDAAFRRRTGELLARVRSCGDAALIAMAREFDGVVLDSLEVPAARCRAALDRLEPDLRRAMERSAANITTAHATLLPRAVEVETEPGVRVGRRPDPLARVGVYAPGGRAAYPSSVLMGAVPARIAGVGEIVLCSPPGADGFPAPSILAAAALASVDRVFRIGGAGAIGAMAYGTATVPRVDRIVGPGNAWVAEAKLQVSSTVGIDAPAGPSELLVIADASVQPRTIAREVLAQAEHDPEAAVVVVVLGGEAVAQAIAAVIEELLPAEARCATIAESLGARGGLCTADSLDEALAFAEAYAPEHLLLAVAAPDAALARVRNAGTVFLGESSSVAFGDYMTGANHVLPTGGLARSWSGLSTSDFVRWTTWQRVEPAAAARLATDVAAFADAEQLTAHAAAAREWAEPKSGPRVDRCAFDLSDNTNLWGMPPAAGRVLSGDARPVNAARYPKVQAADLVGVMAGYLGVDADRIVTGCGSDDVLDSAMRALAEPGDRLAYLDPTFSMIPVFARLNRLVPVAVAAGGLDADADALLSTGARIIYLCSPNNPTGATLPRAMVERIVAEAPGFVILDEAYAEYAGKDCIDLARTSSRLLVTRTMSKAFGLAGLRVGYAVGAPDVVSAVAESRGPYKVNAVAERVAAAALTEDLPWVRERVTEVQRLRERFAEALRGIGLAPLPSAANFVLVPVPRGVALAGRLQAAGVTVRSFEALAGIGDALRITIGPWPMLERCIGALSEVER